MFARNSIILQHHLAFRRAPNQQPFLCNFKGFSGKLSRRGLDVSKRLTLRRATRKRPTSRSNIYAHMRRRTSRNGNRDRTSRLALHQHNHDQRKHHHSHRGIHSPSGSFHELLKAVFTLPAFRRHIPVLRCIRQTRHHVQRVIEFRNGSLTFSRVVQIQRARPDRIERARFRRRARLPHKFHRGIDGHEPIESLSGIRAGRRNPDHFALRIEHRSAAVPVRDRGVRLE